MRQIRASLPVRGAWIEIDEGGRRFIRGQGSLPVRGAWIEIASTLPNSVASWSLPVRGAWIEIATKQRRRKPPRVAPRAGSVD